MAGVYLASNSIPIHLPHVRPLRSIALPCINPTIGAIKLLGQRSVLASEPDPRQSKSIARDTQLHNDDNAIQADHRPLTRFYEYDPVTPCAASLSTLIVLHRTRTVVSDLPYPRFSRLVFHFLLVPSLL